MEKFAGYGFNRSHSAAYALVAYQTAYFKAHHAAAFMAANLSLVMDDTDKVKSFYDDAIAQGLTIVSAERERIALPLRARRRAQHPLWIGWHQGHRPAAINAIVAAREATAPSATCSISAVASTSGS